MIIPNTEALHLAGAFRRIYNASPNEDAREAVVGGLAYQTGCTREAAREALMARVNGTEAVAALLHIVPGAETPEDYGYVMEAMHGRPHMSLSTLRIHIYRGGREHYEDHIVSYEYARHINLREKLTPEQTKDIRDRSIVRTLAHGTGNSVRTLVFVPEGTPEGSVLTTPSGHEYDFRDGRWVARVKPLPEPVSIWDHLQEEEPKKDPSIWDMLR